MIRSTISTFKKNGNKSNLLYVIGGFFIEMLITLAITKLISIQLSKPDFGEYSLFLSAFALISVLPFFSFHTSIERLIVDSDDKKTVIESVLILFTAFFAIYSAVFLFYLLFFNSISYKIMLIFCVYCISRILKTTILTIINVNRYNKATFFLRFTDNIIQFLIILYCFIKKDLTLTLILCSSIISSFLILIYGLRFINNKFNLSYRKFDLDKYWKIINKEIIHFSLPLIFWGIFIWLQNMIGRWYIDAFIDRANVANYSLMTSLAYLPVNAIISIFGGFFVPRIYLKEKENSGYISKANSKIQLISTALWFFIIVFSFYFGDFIIKVFLSKKYLEVSWSLPLLMIGNAIYCIGQLSIYEVYFYKKPKLLIASNVVPGLISLSAGFFLIKYYGYLGAVASNLIAFASSGIITFYVTQKFSKKRAYAY